MSRTAYRALASKILKQAPFLTRPGLEQIDFDRWSRVTRDYTLLLDIRS